MPRRLLGVLVLLLASVSLLRAQGEAVLLTVGAETVTLKEFEYHFCKSSEKRADVFVETYARFKQRALHARAIGLDTLPEFRWQMESFRNAKTLREYKREKMSYANSPVREWIKLKCVSYLLPQNVSRSEIRKGECYMDSIYHALQEKGGSVKVNELPWMQSRYLQQEWLDQLNGLAQGIYSKPFFSPTGIHIVAWENRMMEVPSARSASSVSDSIRMKEMEEGYLVAALDEYLDKTLFCSEHDLEEHFLKHRADYGGGIPHYKGAVIHCKNKKEAKAIKKYLKKYPEALWQEAINRMPKDVSEGCKAETGLFPIGVNPFVDKLVFKCGSFNPLADYPYTWVLGKKLKKGPTDYRDVRSKVQKDCLEAKKSAETEAFSQKYKAEIDKEVLKTVNRAENK